MRVFVHPCITNLILYTYMYMFTIHTYINMYLSIFSLSFLTEYTCHPEKSWQRVTDWHTYTTMCVLVCLCACVCMLACVRDRERLTHILNHCPSKFRTLNQYRADF